MDDLVERLTHWQGDMPDALKADLQLAADRIRSLEAEVANLKDRMFDMMPIAGGNPMRPRPKNMWSGGISSTGKPLSSIGDK